MCNFPKHQKLCLHGQNVTSEYGLIIYFCSKHITTRQGKMAFLQGKTSVPRAFTSQRPSRASVVIRAQAAATTTALNTKRSAEVGWLFVGPGQGDTFFTVENRGRPDCTP